jgi:hypothetical protein
MENGQKSLHRTDFQTSKADWNGNKKVKREHGENLKHANTSQFLLLSKEWTLDLFCYYVNIHLHLLWTWSSTRSFTASSTSSIRPNLVHHGPARTVASCVFHLHFSNYKGMKMMIISDATFPIIGSMYHRVLLHIRCPFYCTKEKHFPFPSPPVHWPCCVVSAWVFRD